MKNDEKKEQEIRTQAILLTDNLKLRDKGVTVSG
jgi:hypothetical protein